MNVLVCFAAALSAAAWGPSADAQKEKVKGSGVTATDSRTVDKFDEVEVSISANVTVTVGEAGPLKITGDDNIVPLIETVVEDGVLKIKTAHRHSTKKGIQIEVSTASLKEVELAGSGDIVVSGLDNEDFEVSLEGAGDITLSGRSAGLNVALEGSGDIKCYELNADSVMVTIEGSGDVEVSANEALTVSITGSGDCDYKGSPKVVAKVTGSGNVTKANS